MIKETKKKKGLFSLTEFCHNRVKRLTLHIEDLKAPMKEGDKKVVVAMVSGTLYLYKDKMITLKDGEDDFYSLNFMLPLDSNKEFRRHILSIIKSAIEAERDSINKSKK